MNARELHREQTMTAIVEAAEELLRVGGPEALTAGAVAKQVGLARNSLYRYVDSMDDLRGRVVMRYLPGAVASIQGAVDKAASPDDALRAYIAENLQIAATENHACMMQLAEGVPGEASAQIAEVHQQLIDAIGRLLVPYQVSDPALAGELIQGVLVAGFGALERGRSLEAVTDYCVAAALGIVRA
ncbi:TetR/AcrR family transcriptional regulator [Corynebacterium hindlerae]|uniref:TetR/AcrR family transcriptional regulator n=1 Tax=Corynebacterium hindlerae TaxID=699041 RepID=A0A7G5FC85_9CORY|nr:helix-turn-helix domain-containing protein [Corynebacterium hindlerae]QMV84226.1 TetR/AcrR family transcriptional regulator [Corynebacterium hindlerae]QTH59900.1 TetR/AcrR family transcriptional regulator [Corynebacterium hindlerae]